MTPPEWTACILFLENRLGTDTALSPEDKKRMERFLEMCKMLTPFAMQLAEGLRRATVPISPDGAKAPADAS